MTREVLQQALEALDELTDKINDDSQLDQYLDVMDDLREALAQPVQPDQNLSCKSTQARLAASWGYVKAQPDQEPSLQEQLADALQSADFYRRRVQAFQQWQSKMRDPERTIVCDIIANGCTLDLSHAGDRYTSPPKRQPLPAHEIVTMYDECPTSDSDMITFARAIEAAHNIGGEQ